MIQASLNFGRATASIQDAIVSPRLYPFRNPTLYLHGVGSAASEAMGAITPSVGPIIAAIADARFPVGATTAPFTWGNTTGRNQTTDVANWLRNVHLATSDGLILIGASHGTTWAFNYAVANPGTVACIVALLPIADLTAVRDGDILGLRAGIDAAWGVSYPTPLPVASDPMQNTAALSSIPIQLWYAPDDPVSVNIASFASSTGAELNSVGALGHSDAAIAAADISSIVSFIRTNA